LTGHAQQTCISVEKNEKVEQTNNINDGHLAFENIRQHTTTTTKKTPSNPFQDVEKD